jgi:hypothetical protein
MRAAPFGAAFLCDALAVKTKLLVHFSGETAPLDDVSKPAEGVHHA